MADWLDIDDMHQTYRVVRTWMHLLRDRLPVNSAAHLAAPLPELLRGVFYDGWRPSRVPDRMHAEGYLLRFQQEAWIPAAEVRATAAAVTGAMRELFPPASSTPSSASCPTTCGRFWTRHRRDAPAHPGNDHVILLATIYPGCHQTSIHRQLATTVHHTTRIFAVFAPPSYPVTAAG
ncbi:DUF2267 domain-containing protein [Actinocrispum sp. NPDC049592]|uniref:DUF2267 domain-containing protein n=1 Tax=Actinocrispum sp. NPDC049592 TaxID=3154835 RepID=UPI003449D253